MKCINFPKCLMGTDVSEIYKIVIVIENGCQIKLDLCMVSKRDT